jgi:flagellar export protein FliJ
MKRFTFSLQTVHNVREIRRDAAERALAAVAAELQGAQGQLERVLRQRQFAMDKYLLILQSQEIDAVTFASHTDYIGSLVLLERQARVMINQVEERINVKRKVLIEASRQTKTTANLRERQRERHHLESAQHEQKMLDEMAVVASTRRLAANGRL